MQLPEDLQKAIEIEIESAGLKELSQAREELTDRYRIPSQKRQFMTSDLQRQSYLATRLPATYAAVYQALQAVKKQNEGLSPASLLDLGAGPGTALWAACNVFSTLESATLLEKDHSLASFGKRLAQHSDHTVIQEARWELVDLEQLPDLPKHDIVTLSYSIGELAPTIIPVLLEKCWQAANHLLVIIEPGTPVGFERIRLIRRQLIEMGGHLVAPCPHHVACPMEGGDWCHFAARVERTSFHRRLKSGSLSYEDEKFSYVAASKLAHPLPPARILRQPHHRSGHSVFTLCTAGGVKQTTVSKRCGSDYKLARKLEWGDSFPFEGLIASQSEEEQS